VTMIVGLTGKDGWLIASDRNQIDATGVRASSSLVKIAADDGLACACAGDGLAILAQSELMRRARDIKVDRRSLRHDLEEFGNQVWAENNIRYQSRFSANADDRGLLIGFAALESPLWSLNIGEKSFVTLRPDRVVAGDCRSSAIFFYQRYSPRIVSLSKLKVLAAHAITIGAELNSSGVGGGLDIAICEGGTISMIEESETRQLIEESWRRDRVIADLFQVELPKQ
jgi:hypothetical protein